MSEQRPLLPKQHSEKMYILARRRNPHELESRADRPMYAIRLSSYDPTGPGMSNSMGEVVLGQLDVTVDVPQDNPLQKEVAELERLRKEVQAEAAKKVMELTDQIDRLLAIEHKPE